MNFSTKIVKWYRQNYRDLPWRNTNDAYLIWLSEIILQQTRVSQGLPYYLKFAAAFPTVFHLANASEQEILKLWQGLGYYSRARNLHFTAKFVVDNLNGQFPNSYHQLIQLKGIGEYTAAAIASFSANEKVAVVDGNVFRVLARVYNVSLDISQNVSKKYFTQLATTLLSDTQPNIHNQAIMEFGALQCVPKNPDCLSCVLNDVCEAFKLNLVTTLPVKTKKIIPKKRYLNYLLIKDADQKYQLQQRIGSGIWENLYEFLCVEYEKETNESKIHEFVNEKYQVATFYHFDTMDVLHKLSHQHLYIKFYFLEVNDVLTCNCYTLEQLKLLPVPIVVHNFMEKIVF